MRFAVLMLAACGSGEAGPPAMTSACGTVLADLGVEYAAAEASIGVEEPIDVTVPIGGIVYRGGDGARATFFMDCPLAIALGRAAEIFAAHDVVEVADYGIYNYRCIGEGTPPDCPNGISQHAFARAIDIAGVTTSGGTTYSVNDDWIIDPEVEDTCAAATESDADAFLHALVCDLHDAGVFNIVLTPNYNDAHRNHWHCDLTPDTIFIR